MHILFPHSVHHRLHRNITAQVDHLKAVVFQNDLDDVLADVVHVALDGGQHDAALAGAALALLGNDVLDLLKSALGSTRGLQQLRQEQRALLVLGAHDVQRRDQRFVHHFQRLLFGQQCLGLGGGIALQALFHRLHQWSVRAGKLCALTGCGCRSRRHRLRSLLEGHRGRHMVGIPLNVFGALRVAVGQHIVSIHRRHHLLAGRVHNGEVKARIHRHGEEGGVQIGAAGQAKADVGHTQNGAHPQLLLAGFQCLHGGQNVLLLGAGGQGQAVDVDVLPRDADGKGRLRDAAGNGHPVLGGGQDAPLIDGKAHDGRTVLFAQGQNRVQLFLLAVGRVDDGLAVVHAQAVFQCLHIGGIQLQRQAGDALQGLDHLGHQGRLVHAGCAHVHVQHLSTGFHLTDRLFQNIVHILFPQCLLEALFARGVDALTHHRDAVHVDEIHRRAEHRGHFVGRTAGYAACKNAVQQLDELRRGAAAAARRKQVQFPVGLHFHGEELRGDIVAAAVGPGQARIGLDEHRKVAGHSLCQTLCHGEDLLGAQ